MKKLVPAGSIVLLKNAVKKLIVIGIMQQKNSEQVEGVPMVYDYIGVPYPEGYIGPNSAFLFNHQDIDQVVFTGYEDEEREGFIEVLSTVYDSAQRTLEEELQRGSESGTTADSSEM